MMGHNSAARKDTIRDIKLKLEEVAESMANLAETRKRIRGRVKAELGWTMKDWNLMLLLSGLEEAESRDATIEALREGFDALNVGQQSSFMDVIDPKPVSAPAAPEKKGKRKSVAERIAEAVLEDTPANQAAHDEIEQQKAQDAVSFDDLETASSEDDIELADA